MATSFPHLPASVSEGALLLAYRGLLTFLPVAGVQRGRARVSVRVRASPPSSYSTALPPPLALPRAASELTFWAAPGQGTSPLLPQETA